MNEDNACATDSVNRKRSRQSTDFKANHARDTPDIDASVTDSLRSHCSKKRKRRLNQPQQERQVQPQQERQVQPQQERQVQPQQDPLHQNPCLANDAIRDRLAASLLTFSAACACVAATCFERAAALLLSSRPDENTPSFLSSQNMPSSVSSHNVQTSATSYCATTSVSSQERPIAPHQDESDAVDDDDFVSSFSEISSISARSDSAFSDLGCSAAACIEHENDRIQARNEETQDIVCCDANAFIESAAAALTSATKAETISETMSESPFRCCPGDVQAADANTEESNSCCEGMAEFLRSAHAAHDAHDAAASISNQIPTRLAPGETASIPPLPHHTQYFVPGAPRFMFPEKLVPGPQHVDVHPDPRPLDEQLTPQQYYDRFVCASDQKCLSERGAPQGSVLWLDARTEPVTASTFGAAIGESKHKTPEETVEAKIWNTFQGNEATKWGNAHEPHAQESFEAWFPRWLAQRCDDAESDSQAKLACLASVRYFHDNLIRFAKTPWMGVSPDGFVEWLDVDGENKLALCEWKCAYTARGSMTDEHPYKSHCHALFAKNVPVYYGFQMLGVGGYLNEHLDALGAMPRPISLYFFGVWTPLRFYVTLMEHNQEHYERILKPRLRNFYFNLLLPARTHLYNRKLSFCRTTMRGTIRPDPPMLLDSDEMDG